MTRQALAALITLWLIGASAAEAEKQCSELLAPLSLSLLDSGLDQSRAACAANTMSAGARAFARAEAGSFDEVLSASLFLDYRILHLSGFEFGVGARVVDHRFEQAGSESAKTFLGPVHLDVLRPNKRTWFGKPLVLSHAIRLDLPLTNTADDDFTIAVSPSIVVSIFLSEALHLHGRIAGLLLSVVPESGADSEAALATTVDLAYSPLSFAALLVGAEVQGGLYGPGLDHVQARAGLRVAAGPSAALEFSVGASFFGEQPIDFVTWFGYRRSITPAKQGKTSRLQDWAR